MIVKHSQEMQKLDESGLAKLLRGMVVGPRHGTADARFGFEASVHDSSAHTRDSRVVSHSVMGHRAASLQIH